jgi:hypothetical protein
MLRSSGPLMEKKFREHDVATAFANKVFPVPGGPYKRIPGRNNVNFKIIDRMRFPTRSFLKSFGK